MTIAIFGNTYKRETMDDVAHILDFMKSKDVRVLLSQELRHEMNLMTQYDPFTEETTELPDFALSVGGDGTFLTTASVIGDRNIPILGVNSGHLGFLAEVEVSNLDQILQHLVEHDYFVEERSVLQVSTSIDCHITHPYALNEVAVMKQELSSMISVETKINGEYLHTYRADGLVVATPTGSTAYNLSVGGPLVSPHVDGILLSPIATHSLNVRPLLIPDDRQIDMKIHSRSGSFLISVDGRSQAVRDDVELTVKLAPYTIKLVHLGQRTFIQTLRDKLLWGAE